MIIGIQPDQIGSESHSQKWAEFLRDRGVEVRWLDLLSPSALEQASQCDGIMWRWTHSPRLKTVGKQVLYAIEHYLNLPVYPNSATAWHYDEKTAQFYLLDLLQAPVPQTWLFWQEAAALEWAETAPYPVVFKLSVGASSATVIKVNQPAEATRLIQQLFRYGIFPHMLQPEPVHLPSLANIKFLLRRTIDAVSYVGSKRYPKLHPVWWKPEHGYAYFQEFLPDNKFDTRVTVIGDRAFAFRRFNRPADFRASGSGHFDVNPQAIDLRCIKIAFDISDRGKFQSMAYDFLYKSSQPVINEISYTFVDWAVHRCPGYWNKSLDWVEGQMYPEAAQVEDFMVEVELKKAIRTD